MLQTITQKITANRIIYALLVGVDKNTPFPAMDVVRGD